MVVLCGIPTESTLALVRERLEEMRVPHLVLSQRRFDETGFRFEIRNGEVAGELSLDGRTWDLRQFTAVYTRLMDDRFLPELEKQPAGSRLRLRSRAWHDAVMHWYEIAPIAVVNRSAAMSSNGSKPLQAQMIVRHGFLTPETLITSDPALARTFITEHGRVVFKSASGVRSIVTEVEEGDLARLEHIRWCPVQFQAFVPGRNVRVHVVGDEVFATGIDTEATDYRYAHRQRGAAATLFEVELSDDVAAQAIGLARDLGLAFAGIDLKITPADDVYCFEVNPSPGYSYYESQTGQGISGALARYLARHVSA